MTAPSQPNDELDKAIERLLSLCTLEQSHLINRGTRVDTEMVCNAAQHSKELEKALVNSNDAAEKFEAKLKEAESALEQAGLVHKTLENVIGLKCLPSQMSRFVEEKLNSVEKERDELKSIHHGEESMAGRIVRQNQELSQLRATIETLKANGPSCGGCH